MTSRTPRALSERSERVLRAIAGSATPLHGAGALVSVAGTERGAYESLITLHRKFLIRWDEGGRNIRATDAGRRMIRAGITRSSRR